MISFIYILFFCQIRKENEHYNPNGLYGNKGFVNLLKVMPRDTKEHEVKCTVYNSTIKLVTVFWYSLENIDIILQKNEASVSKGFISVFVKY